MTLPDDQPGRARIATISALMVVSSFVAGKAARDAILLSRFSIESLPYFIAASAALALPIILVAGRLMHRFGPARLVPLMNVVSGVMAIAEWALIGAYPRPIAVLAFFHFSTASAVLVSGFWSIVNERFDIQSAKRHIGRIGVGATLGGILGGVIAERSAVYLAPDAILLVLAGLQLACAGMLWAFGRGAAAAPPAEGAATAGAWSALGVVSRSQLLRLVAGVVVLGAVAAGVMDYVFKADIVAASSKESLLRGLAVFYTITNVVTAIIQVGVCGPAIAKLGVPRSVATLPVTVTAFGALALLVPGVASAAIARAAELVTRNSFYRAGYELLYAPLPEEQKRPTKVVLDVGADKVGDILGAQLVAGIVYLVMVPRTALLVATLVVGVLTVLLALRLPRTYSKALEASLLSRASEMMASGPTTVPQPEPWLTMTRLPRFGEAGEVVPVSLRGRRRRARQQTPPALVAAATPPRGTPAAAPGRDPLVDVLRELRSGDLARAQAALAAPLPVELAAHAIALVDHPELARPALAAIAQVASQCTGLLVDALADAQRSPRLRGRLAHVLMRGEPQLAAWGLWRGLHDEAFEVRFRCSAALARLAAAGQFTLASRDDVFAAVREELVADRTEWKRRQLVDDVGAIDPSDGEPVEVVGESALEHVFRVLELVLPAEPLRIALRAVQTDDVALRGTALEYLESILPADVRARLWPLLEHADEGAAGAVSDALPALAEAAEQADAQAETSAASLPVAGPPRKRSPDELVADLRTSYPAIVERLKPRAKQPPP